MFLTSMLDLMIHVLLLVQVNQNDQQHLEDFSRQEMLLILLVPDRRL